MSRTVFLWLPLMTDKRLMVKPRCILDGEPRLLLARRLSSVEFIRGVVGTTRRYGVEFLNGL
jgi:hypothetical protein